MLSLRRHTRPPLPVAGGRGDGMHALILGGFMKVFLLATALTWAAVPALAQTAANCTANDGQYLTGVVSKAPYYVKASETIDGVQLSHTHVTVKSSANGKQYDVAIDNVFNPTWVKNSTKVPSNLTPIKLGTQLSLCGLLYTSGSPGIHWVHDSCGDTSASNPNGWTSIVTGSTVGPNLENSETYCYLFGG